MSEMRKKLMELGLVWKLVAWLDSHAIFNVCAKCGIIGRRHFDYYKGERLAYCVICNSR